MPLALETNWRYRVLLRKSRRFVLRVRATTAGRVDAAVVMGCDHRHAPLKGATTSRLLGHFSPFEDGLRVLGPLFSRP